MATSATTDSRSSHREIELGPPHANCRQRARHHHDDRPEPHERRIVGMPQATSDHVRTPVDSHRYRPSAQICRARSDRHRRQRVKPAVMPAGRVCSRHARPFRRGSGPEARGWDLRRRLIEVVHRRVVIHGHAGGREPQIRRPAVVQDDDRFRRWDPQPQTLIAVDDLRIEAGRKLTDSRPVARRDRRDRAVRYSRARKRGQHRTRHCERQGRAPCPTTDHRLRVGHNRGRDTVCTSPAHRK